MQTRSLSLPTLALIASTRGMLGAGIALLLANKLTDARRRGIGRSLLAVGALSTIPLAWRVFRHGGHEAELTQSDSHEVPIRRGRHQMLPIATPMLQGRR